LDEERPVLLDAVRDCTFSIPSQWTTDQRALLSGCRRPRMQKIGKWLGVPLLRRRIPSVPGSLIADRSAIQDIYGYNFDEVSANPLIMSTLAGESGEAIFKLLVSHFFDNGASPGPQDTWIETHDKSRNVFIEKWRCSYDGKWLTVLSELRFVMCKYRKSCRDNRRAGVPWFKGGDYCIPGWPAALQRGACGSRKKTRWEMVCLLQGRGQAEI
jgi:hypothetical protein